MGLLDIYNDYLERMRNIKPADDFSGMNTDIMPPQTDSRGVVLGGDQRKESPLIKDPMFPGLPVGKSTSQQETPDARDIQKTSMQNMGLGNDQDFLQKMSSLAKIDFSKAAATWKDKGGFDALMANPAFTLGLAFMQAGAEGKTIGKAGLDSVLKAGAISQNYKKIVADKTEIKEVTEGQMNSVKDVLDKSFNISAPNLMRLKPGNQTESYEQAVEDIANKVQTRAREKVKAAKAKGQDLTLGKRLYKEVIQEMIDSGEIDKKGGLSIGGVSLIDATLEAREQGGPVQENKSYLVGEKGPEVFIPKETGEVVANDDTQVFSMLLAANPQLQKVSKERAMKILKAKFPEYFD
tara:strand:- start:1168 stop:2220 length:1053 start_codon:yes stop_codon:yes gene_type:complete